MIKNVNLGASDNTFYNQFNTGCVLSWRFASWIMIFLFPIKENFIFLHLNIQLKTGQLNLLCIVKKNEGEEVTHRFNVYEVFGMILSLDKEKKKFNRDYYTRLKIAHSHHSQSSLPINSWHPK
ncbi:uncharacterized protein LOC143244601 [Tachypleus tridentatus]|uniref:uncharacterized protein LOC143244601 n=1 Tax=Tachypleus tridentatus TaxID=6853 RepID=UPI003FCFE48B